MNCRFWSENASALTHPLRAHAVEHVGVADYASTIKTETIFEFPPKDIFGRFEDLGNR